MDPHETKEPSVIDALEALRREVAQLSDRIATLEAASPRVSTEVYKPSVAPVEINEELIAIISAAIAAFLGITPRIRQVSLVGGASWAQQGRVTIQASHALSIRHD